jgi:hypothetical protein
MQFIPGPDGSLEVFSGITADGVALKSDVALEAELAKHLEKDSLIVAAPVQSLNELAPAAASFFGPASTDLPKERLGLGEGGLEVGLRLDFQVVTQVEHHTHVFPFAFASNAHGGTQGIDVKSGMRIEDDAQARLVRLVGDLAYEGHRLFVGVALLAALDEQLEDGFATLEVLDRLADFLAVSVPF